MDRDRSAALRLGVLRALPFALAVAAHAPALVAGFVHDDLPQIRDNPLLRGLGTLPVLWSTGVWAGAGSGSSFFRPLFTTSLALDIRALGPSPLALHATQLVWFGIVAVLAAAAVRRIGASADGAAPRTLAGAGLAAGAAVAVHPVNSEAAAWVSARPDVLQAVAGLAALLLHDTAVRREAAGAPGLGRSRLAVAGALFLAVCAKESAVAFGAGLLAIDVVRGVPLGPRRLARRYAACAAAALVYAALRSRALGSLSGGLVGASDPRDLLGAVGQGALRLLAPIELTISPPPPSGADAVLGVLVLAAAAVGAAWGVRGRRTWLVPLALGASALVVGASGAARIGEMADRYLLVPCIATAWLAAHGAASLPPRARRVALVALVPFLAAGAALSWRHTSVFHSNETLWTDAYRKYPGSVRPPLNLSAVLLEAGDPHGALVWLERAERAAPGDFQVALNRANALQQLGDVAAAERELRALVVREPTLPTARLALAHLVLEGGAPDEAARLYEEVVARFPNAAEAWAGLGVARARQGRHDDARRALSRALALDPNVQNADVLRRMLDTLPR